MQEKANPTHPASFGQTASVQRTKVCESRIMKWLTSAWNLELPEINTKSKENISGIFIL